MLLVCGFFHAPISSLDLLLKQTKIPFCSAGTTGSNETA